MTKQSSHFDRPKAVSEVEGLDRRGAFRTPRDDNRVKATGVGIKDISSPDITIRNLPLLFGPAADASYRHSRFAVPTELIIFDDEPPLTHVTTGLLFHQGFLTTRTSAPLSATSIERRNPTASDVQIKILYCGVCHSDLHFVRNEWGFTQYPAVPGHEIVGRVTAVGSDVKKFKAGDMVGVGCLVDSCRTCPDCKNGLEQFCNGMVMTYGGMEKQLDRPTLGGYAQSIVVTEDFVLRIPANLKLAAVAPLLCAGITTYSPMRHWKVGPGQKVGIVGLGGLGHMGVKFARAFGAHVVLFTTTPGKTEDAKRLGTHEVVVSDILTSARTTWVRGETN